ncbi:MAG: D-alanyl-D-alanine carboxypeptidase [Rickettsiales bacterium]|jgi:D-alanyl-D-alanine carboxypeptidase (penicillin-binding protein 5/6)|nr:D-alanyl-D-alanine carboxypeptidase [Rickettsiales bacterium]
MKKICILAFAAYLAISSSRAAFQGSAKSYYLVDFQSGQAIASKSPDDLMPPSSMLKLMTAELAFGALKSGKLKMNDKLPVSRAADYKNPVLAGASKVCLEQGQTITVEDALAGLIAVSGGDAAIVLAEKLVGTERQFVEMMTRRAREIGMEYTSFGNASGLPDADNLSTSRELMILAGHIFRTYPEYLHFFKIRRFEFVNPLSDFCRSWAKSHAINYNKLLFIMGGAEGMKTGHTSKGGYGVVAAASRRGRRLIGVINGLPAKNHDALAAEAKRLLEYGYENTFNQEIKSEIAVPVWYGAEETVRAKTKHPFFLTFENGANLGGLRVVALVSGKIAAPVRKGGEIGTAVAYMNGVEIKSEKLYATESVPRVRFFGRMFRNIKYFLTRK